MSKTYGKSKLNKFMAEALISDDISVVQAPDDTDVLIAMTGVKLANQNKNPAKTDSIVEMENKRIKIVNNILKKMFMQKHLSYKNITKFQDFLIM